jgi:tetratricopeptide (TPR) repeat protein
VSATPRKSADQAAPSSGLSPGHKLGERFTITRLLGRGAFGDVYLARDLELRRDVALKVLRSEIAESPVALERFKHEIGLSSQITSRNVLRVYDINEADGLRFLSMEYVEGRDLAHVLKTEGKPPLDRAITIIRQICHGLMAAHELHIIHRDLKPHNVMIDGKGRVYLTDFGLAKLEGAAGVTRTDQVLGTPAYMSPEQVKAEPVDQRSDIYALGIMFYQLVTGDVPFREGTPYETMMARLNKAPKPVRELVSDVPDHVERIIEGCLAIAPEARYASVDDILAELDAAGLRTGPIERVSGDLSNDVRASSPNVPAPAMASAERVGADASARSAKRRRRVWWIPLVVVGVAGGAGGVLRRMTKTSTPASAPATAPVIPSATVGSASVHAPAGPLKVLIADFENRTGDPIFHDTIETMLAIGLESASLVTAFNRVDARTALAEIRPTNPALDAAGARLIAARESIAVIATGEIERRGSGYLLRGRALDAVTGGVLREAEQPAADKTQVPVAASQLAVTLRDALDTSPASKRVTASEMVTTTSLEALQAFLRGQQLTRETKFEEAIAALKEAIRLDPKLARAYASLGTLQFELKQFAEGQASYGLALKNEERMTRRERLRTMGSYYLDVSHNVLKAIEVFGELVRDYPGDYAAHSNLAWAYGSLGRFRESRDEIQRVLELNPRSILDHYNLGATLLFLGDREAAIREVTQVIAANPKIATPHFVLATARVLGGDLAAGRAQYRKALDVSGGAIGRSGLADLLLYEGKSREAATYIAQAIVDDRAAGDEHQLDQKFMMLAEAKLALGDRSGALAAMKEAMTKSDHESIRVPAGVMLAGLGQADKAEAIAAELDKTLQPQLMAYAAIVRGAIALHAKRYAAATQLLRGSFTQRDNWVGRLLLARAYIEAERYSDALGELEMCVERQGEAADAFTYDTPTLRYLPPLYYYLGRAHEALHTGKAGEFYDRFLSIRGASDPADPLVVDAKRRRAAH